MRTPQRPKSEVRKIQLTGGSTYIVSLPKRWVSEHGISPKDQVRVEWRPSGNLRVMPEASTILRRRELEIDLDKITINFLLDHLIGAYLSGAQLIRIFSKSGFERKHRKVFRTFIQYWLIIASLLALLQRCSKSSCGGGSCQEPVCLYMCTSLERQIQ